MIIARIFNGLGNQMFQYAFGRQVAERCGRRLKLDLERFATDERSYGLHHFNIEADIMTPDELLEYQEIMSPNRFARGCDRLIRKVRPQYRRMIKERFFQYDPTVEYITARACLSGYWQSERYFTDIAGLIRAELTLKEPLSAQSQSVAEGIDGSESVSLHIRRGDYITNPRTAVIFGLCTPDYYREAVKLIAGRVKNPTLYVFSDDIQWVRESLTFPCPTVYVDFNGVERDYEDIHLMSRCKHHVIANSSFSWWGAWLGEKPGQIAIAPKRWFQSPVMNTSDVVPERWIKL